MEKTSSTSGWIMTINPVQAPIFWATESEDISGLTNYTSVPNDIQASCTNTDIITAYGNSSRYPAAWAAKNYNPTGIASEKNWCLPSAGLLQNSLNNQTNLNIIHLGISTAGDKVIGLGYPSYPYEAIWSSSEYSNRNAWHFRIDSSGSFNISYDVKYFNFYAHTVRLVMPF